MEEYCKQMLINYKLLMRIKLLLFSMLFAGSSWATTYVFPGNAVAPIALQDTDTLEILSGTFTGGTSFTVMNGPTTSTGQTVTVDVGASLVSSAGSGAIYAPYNGPFHIINNGTITGSSSAIIAHASLVTLTQNSTIPIKGMILLGDSGTVNFNSTAGTDDFLYTGINATLNFNSSGSPASGIVGSSGTILNVNNSITLPPISFVDTININSGTTTLNNVTSLAKSINVASGTTLALGNHTITGTGTITQAGTFTSSSNTALTGYTGIFTSSGTTTLAAQTTNSDFRVTGGTTNITGTGSFIVNNSCTVSGGTLDAGQSFFIINNNASMHQTGGTFKINSSGANGSFSIASGGSYTIDGGTFNRGSAGSTSWNNANFTVNGGTVNYANGITVNGGTFNINGGVFNYTATTAININGTTVNITGGEFIGPSAGSLFINPGSVLNVSGGTLDFAQLIFINNDVTINVSGTPTIILRQGQTFLSNVNIIINSAFGPSTLAETQFPNTGVDFSNAVYNITNNNNVYVASGDYIIANAAGAFIPGVVNLPANTAFQQYSLGAGPGGFGTIAFVRVVRSGLGSVATNPNSQGMGVFLEQVASSLGSSNPNSALFTAMSAIESAAGTGSFDEDLYQISPQNVITFPVISNVDVLFQQIDTHLLATRGKKYYSAGDELYKNDVWLAPFGGYAYQSTDDNLDGYVTKAAGVTLGIERQVTTTSLLGFAGSYINNRVEPTENRSSHTNIRTYQLTLYGTFNIMRNQHLDWLAAYNTNMNFSHRNIGFMNANATAKYNTNLYAGKLIYSNDIFSTSTTLSPQLSLEYVHLHQQNYQESGADGLDYNVAPTHTALLRLGVGAWLTFMQKAQRHCMVPQLFAEITYDAKDASQNISANFVNTTPVFNEQASTPRLGGMVGGRLTYMFRDNLFIIGNVNVQGKNHYINVYGDLRLKYYF